MNTINDIGIEIPKVLLPRTDIELDKWAVIACDQFTSEPQYWQSVEQIVGAAPSTLALILPEAYLGQTDELDRIRQIQATMRRYVTTGILQPHEGMVYVERDVAGKRRKGLVLALDLERYDYTAGSSSLIRPTEGTIVDRLLPRIQVRQGAELELPHILVLIDDADCTVIEPLAESKAELEVLYSFDLMRNSGHLAGYALSEALQHRAIGALRNLAEPRAFTTKYGLTAESAPLLFAVGDGNHSLAAAKALWARSKSHVGMSHPSRFALVEVVNVHDSGLVFEAIHRVLFGLKLDLPSALATFFGTSMVYTTVSNFQDMAREVDAAPPEKQRVGLVGGGTQFAVIEITSPPSSLAVATIQAFIDQLIQAGDGQRVDYVHGMDVLHRLGLQTGNAGFYLPALRKSDLFKSVIVDGALPRKTFSLGEARAKRFYMEARRITL